MSYSEDRADSRSLTAVALVLLGIAVIAMLFYFAIWAPSRNTPDTTVITAPVQGPAGAPGQPGATGQSGMPGMNGAQGSQGATGAAGAAGATGEPGSTDPTTGTTGG